MCFSRVIITNVLPPFSVHSVCSYYTRDANAPIKYGKNTAVKPYNTLRNLLVHPKDKRTIGQTVECVYKILCHNCSSAYIGETGQSYGKRQEEHRKEVESISNRTLTQADRKDLAAETNKSAITDLSLIHI